jgi:hypothetical protein
MLIEQDERKKKKVKCDKKQGFLLLFVGKQKRIVIIKVNANK